MERGKKNVVIIDGYGFVFRAFFSLSDFKTSKGEPVGAVYGFINMILKVLNSLQPDYLIVVFDSGKKTFRSDIYQEYKAHRKEAPEDLKPQFVVVREAVKAMNIGFAQTDGFEADDVIATYSNIAQNSNFKCIIVSSDKDLMQLTKDGVVEFYDPMKGKFLKEADVEAKFGVKPHQVRDFLSILGDASDNIPGIKGIGEKGAGELLQTFLTLENIYSNLEKISKPRLKKLLEEGREMAFLSQKLASLHFDVDVPPIEDFKLKPFDRGILYDFLSRYELNSIIAKLVPEYNKAQVDLFEMPKKNAENKIIEISDALALEGFLKEIEGSEIVIEVRSDDLHLKADVRESLLKNWWVE
jgi:DNA polymerase-1